MSKLAMGMLVALCINSFLFMGQTAIESINPGTNAFDKTNTLINVPDSGGGVLDENVQDNLPSSGSSVTQSSLGGFFTDPFTSIKNWFLGPLGGSYLIAFLFAVPNFLKAMGLPSALTFVISSLWYSYSLIVFLLFLWGDRD